MRSPLQGLRVANLSPDLADSLTINMLETGVIVMDVKRNSTSNRFGFRRLDIILEINGVKIESVEVIKKILNRNYKEWRITIKREGKMLSLNVSN